METKLQNLVKQVGTDVSGKWIAVDKIDQLAESIVRECMKLNSKELSITAIERLLPLYQEHFGVE
jgi:hypothetical protein